MKDAAPGTIGGGPPAKDFELFSVKVRITKEDVLVVEEFTLRQRDQIADQLAELTHDEEFDGFIRTIFADGFGEDDDVEIDVIATVKLLVRKLGAGALSKFLSIVVDNKSNEDVWGDSKPVDWVRDNVRISSEMWLLEAMVKTNDVVGYLKNWIALAPIAVTKARETGANLETGKAD